MSRGPAAEDSGAHPSALERYRRAEEGLRRELDARLAPAGLRVMGLRAGRAGWLLRLREREPDGSTPGGGGGGGGEAGTAGGDGVEGGAPGPGARGWLAPPERRAGESLAALLARMATGPRSGAGARAGGLHVEAPDEDIRREWLAGALVGEGVLALRERGEAEGGPAGAEELKRRLAVLLEEEGGGAGGVAPFRAAVEAWLPAGAPPALAAALEEAEAPHA